jgi:hypothetical protein
MFATGNVTTIWLYALMIISLFPIMSCLGHIFTSEGRATLRANPFMGLYYLIFFTFAYFFWLYPNLIHDYIGIGIIFQKVLYASLCIVPILEKGLPN